MNNHVGSFSSLFHIQFYVTGDCVSKEIPGISTNFTDHDSTRCESTHNRRLNVDFREQRERERERRGRDSSKDGDGGEQVIGYELLVSTLDSLSFLFAV